MYKKSSPTVKAAVFTLIAAITAQLSLFPLAAVSLAQEPSSETSEVVIPDGTELTVTTTEEITSKTATEGDPLSFKVTEDVKVNGRVVIAEGTLVKGVVANAKKAGMMGKEGDDKTGTTVALVVLFGPLGLLKHGKNAKIKSGTQIKVFTDEEKKVQA